MLWQPVNQRIVRSFSIQAIDQVKNLGALASSTVTVRIKDSDFLWCAAVASSTNTFKTRCRIDGDAQWIDSDFVRSENFWGSAQQPLWHPPKFLPLNAQIQFDFVDTSNATNTINLYLWGYRAFTHLDVGDHKGEPAQRWEEEMRTRQCCLCDGCRYGIGRGLFVLHSQNGGTSITYGANAYGIQIPQNQQATVGTVLTPPDRYHFRAPMGTQVATSNLWKTNIQRWDPRDERLGKITAADVLVKAPSLFGTANLPAIYPSPILVARGTPIVLDPTDDGSGGNNTAHVCFPGELLDDELLRMGA